MNEKQFISKLKRNLSGLSSEDKKEILADYGEHFKMGREEGKSEEDICNSLGDPAALGKNSRAELLVDRLDEESTAGIVFKAVIASFSLGLFNIIFVLGPYLGLVAAMAGLWITAVSMTLSGVAAVLFIIFKPLIKLFEPYVMNPDSFGLSLAVFLGGIALFCLGSLAVIGMVKLTKLFIRGTVKYLQSNARIIKRSR